MLGKSLTLGAAGNAAGETDEYFNQTVLLLHGDGSDGDNNNTFLDSGTANSGSGFTITRNPASGPNAPTQGTFSPFSAPDGRWSAFINNADSYVSYGSSADFTFSTGDFTVEAWVYVSSIDAGEVFNIFNVGDASTGSYSIYVLANGKIESTRYGDGAGDGQTTNTIAFNTWNHIAAVRSGGTAKVYINGVADTGSSYSMGDVTATAGETGRVWQTAYTASGYVSNLRVCKGTAVYTSDFTPSTEPLTSTSQSASNCKLLTLQSNRFVDKNTATTAKTVTISGTPKITPFSSFAPTAAYDPAVNGGSGYFDGTGDYLTIADNASLEPSNLDFTIECWIYPTATGSFLGVFSKRINNSTGYSPVQVLINDGTMGLFASTTGSSWAVNTTASSSPPLNAWSHIAVVRNGTGSDNLVLYLNGVSVATGSVSSTALSDNAGAWAIGADSDDGGGNFAGYISSFRYVRGSAEVPASGGPTAPPTNITNTSLLLNFTNAGIYDNTGKNNLETVADAQIDTTTKKYGTGSLEFDGTGDYIDVPSSTEFGFNTGAFTIEFWLYLNTVLGTQNLFDMRSGATNQVALTLYMNGASPRLYVDGADRITGSNISTGQWYYIALTRSGTDTKLFVDAVQSGSTYSDSNDYLTPRPLRIGTTNDGVVQFPLNGFIDDLRITKGVARTITVPTKAYPDL